MPPPIAAPKYLSLKIKDFRDGMGISPYQKNNLPLYKRVTPQTLERLKVQALDDLWCFLDLIDFYGGTENFEPIHKTLCKFLTGTRDDRLVLMPRGHFKSTICSTLYVLWRIYKDPNIRIKVGSAGKDLAVGFTRQVMQFFEDPELQQYVWNNRPHVSGPLVPDLDRTGSRRKRGNRLRKVKDDILDPDAFGGYTEEIEDIEGRKIVWRANALQVNRPKNMKEPTLYACSVGVIMAGWHYDLAIMDDLCNRVNAATPEKMKKILGWVDDVTSVLDPRDLNGPGLGEEMVFLGTRYYKWDLYGHLLGEDLDTEEEKIEYWQDQKDAPLHILQRDIYGNGIGTLTNNVWSEETPQWEKYSSPEYMCPMLFNIRIEKKKKRNRRWFYSQYLNKIYDPEGVLLNYEQINFFKIHHTRYHNNQIVLQISDNPSDPAIHLNLVTVVDPAASTNETADYMCITTGGYDYEGNLYIVDMKYGHWMPSQFAKEISSQLDRWNQSRVVVEANGVQKYIVNNLKEQFKALNKTYYIKEENPQGDKKQNILNSLEPLFSERKLFLSDWIDRLSEPKEECKHFPAEGARDDVLDTLKMLTSHCRPTRPVTDHSLRMKKRNRVAHINSQYGGIR